MTQEAEVELPFTSQQFYQVFGEYNEIVWPVQFLITGLALAAISFVLAPRRWSDRAASAILALLWAWMAIAYHFAFFARINPAAYAFAALSLAGAVCFLWYGVLHGDLHFAWTGGMRAFSGVALIVFALAVYPAWSWYAGHWFPAMPTFGLPCPTTIFTIGLLCFLTPPYPRAPLIAPILWSFIGAQAAILLGVPQDLGLVLAAGAGLVLLMRAKPHLTLHGATQSLEGGKLLRQRKEKKRPATGPKP
jgi:hypothetical protein